MGHRCCPRQACWWLKKERKVEVDHVHIQRHAEFNEAVLRSGERSTSDYAPHRYSKSLLYIAQALILFPRSR